jgi:hypothetical protein
MLSDQRNRVTATGSSFTIVAPNGSTLAGRTAAGTEPVVQTRTQTLNNPTVDIGSKVPVVYTTTPPQRAFDQLAVLALTPAGAEPAVTETIRVVGGNAIGLTWRGVQDVIVRRRSTAGGVTGPISTDAEIAKFTRDAGETVMRGGTRLADGSRQYVDVSGTAATVTVSGDEVAAAGDPANGYRVFAPQTISSVAVNGAAAPSCREGSYLQFPCSP